MTKRRGTGNSVTPFSRDYRRVKKFAMGLPPRRPRSRWRRILARMSDPVACLKAVILVSLVALLALPLGVDAVNAGLKPARDGKGGTCRILAVIDGDTLSIRCAGGGITRARLTGFDAPELYSPGCAGEYLAAQKSAWALRAMILGAGRIDIAIAGRDRYGRALVDLRLDGGSAAARMIAAGHARPHDGGPRAPWCAAVRAPGLPSGDAWQGRPVPPAE